MPPLDNSIRQHTPASNIHHRISRTGNPRSSSVRHWNTSGPFRIRTAFTRTRRPCQGWNGYRTSRTSLIWVFRCLVVQHRASAQCTEVSCSRAGELGRGSLESPPIKSPFACKILHKAGCGRRPGSDDELATLGLDPGQTHPKMQAKRYLEARHDPVLRTVLYSLSNWCKFPGQARSVSVYQGYRRRRDESADGPSPTRRYGEDHEHYRRQTNRCKTSAPKRCYSHPPAPFSVEGRFVVFPDLAAAVRGFEPG
jgi:hypothetical protein